jgi:hypothetical protein
MAVQPTRVTITGQPRVQRMRARTIESPATNSSTPLSEMRGALLVSQIRKFIASEVPIAIEVGPINPAIRFDVVISASLCSFAADAVRRRCAWLARPGAPSLHVVPNCGRALRDHADRLSGCVSGQNPPGAVERPGIRAPRLCPAVPAGPGLSVASFRLKVAGAISARHSAHGFGRDPKVRAISIADGRSAFIDLLLVPLQIPTVTRALARCRSW